MKMTMAALLERLRRDLLGLSPGEFERAAVLGVAAFADRPMRRASAGQAPGASPAGMAAAALVAGREAVAAEFPSIAAALATLTAHPHCAEAVEALRGQMAGDTPGWPVYDPSLVYRRGRSPTALLDARYRIVPLMNRDNDVAEWSDWARGTLGTLGARSSARVLTGDGCRLAK